MKDDMGSTGGRKATILLIEDNPGDVRLVEEAFEDSHFHNDLYSVTDGKAAREVIHRDGAHEDAPRPDIILLDLHLPKVDGEDLLHEIKHHPELGQVPVIILTGLDDDHLESRDLDEDVDEDAVLEKPIDLDEFRDVIRDLDGFGLSDIHTGGEDGMPS